AEERRFAGHKSSRQELGDDRFVQRRANGAPGKNRLDLRSEYELVIGPSVVERLDAEPVARQQQPPALPVPQRKRKHPLEPLDAALPFLLVQMQERLGVAAPPTAVTALPQLGPQARRLVLFAFVADALVAVLVRP